MEGYVCINGKSIIHHVLMMNVHKFQINRSRLKSSGYRIQTKQTVRTRISEHVGDINDFKKGYQPRTNKAKNEDFTR